MTYSLRSKTMHYQVYRYQLRETLLAELFLELSVQGLGWKQFCIAGRSPKQKD